MAKIKGVGAPTKKTKGGIGDIYTDKTTGKQYKCTGSYGSAAYDTEYDWKAVTTFGKNGPNPVTTKEKPEVKVEAPVEEIVEPEVTEGVDGEAVEETQTEEPKKSKQSKGKSRTNYAAAYNNKQ